MTFNKAPEDIKIVGATKGSIILEFSLLTEIAGIFGTIIFYVLKVTEKVLNIRIKKEELKEMGLKNISVIQDLEKEAEDQKKDGVATITKELIKKYKLDNKNDAEKIKALEISVKKLLDFTNDGGGVDFVEPTSKDGDSDKSNNKNLEVYNVFPKIRELEHRIQLLENKQDL